MSSLPPILLTSRSLIVQAAIVTELAIPNWTGSTPVQLAEAGRLHPSASRAWALRLLNGELGSAWYRSYGFVDYMLMSAKFVKGFCEEVERVYFESNGSSQ